MGTATTDGSVCATGRVTGGPFVSVVEAHVDWVTLTSAGAARRPLFDRLARQLLDQLRDAGNDKRPWAWQGFAGERCGPFSWGSRSDCSIVTMSGAVSATFWRRFWPLSTNCSRVDLAVTVEATSEEVDYVQRSWQQFVSWKRTNPQSAGWSLVQNHEGGSTLYLGRRSSDWFCRVYRKDREDPSYDRPSWRFELELKRKPAIDCLRYLAPVRTEAQSILATLGDYLRRRGIDCPWRSDGAALALRQPPTRTDTTRRLDWFRVQVAPAVAEVLQHVPREVVLEALGLQSNQGT